LTGGGVVDAGAIDKVIDVLKSLDEDRKKRQLIAVITPDQAKILRKKIREEADSSIYPIIHPYFRKDKKTGKVRVYRSRRLVEPRRHPNQYFFKSPYE
jgi:hypothetical protein